MGSGAPAPRAPRAPRAPAPGDEARGYNRSVACATTVPRRAVPLRPARSRGGRPLRRCSTHRARGASRSTVTEPAAGWKQLLPPGPWYRRPGAYPIPAYSEFMPPPRLGRRAYGGARDTVLFAEDDPWGWREIGRA